MEDTSKKTILIVEDEKPILNVLKMKLISGGFSVAEATDGQVGLETALKIHPDLILLDVMLPVMDGVTLLESLRVDDWGKNVPVIILSNLNDASTIQESKDKGVHDYLVKTDWKLDDVMGKIKERLNLN
jgi:DNA-binding response OmpR family regulator